MNNPMNNLKTALATLAAIVPPVVSRAPKTYPFVGQNACRAALRSDRRVREAMMAVLFHCQTEHEQIARDTKDDNKRGFMSSHAWHGTLIGRKVSDGAELTPEESDRVDSYAVVYAKQMAAALRAFAIAEEPELGISARVFGV